MAMAMISPSEREVSLTEQLLQSPRLVPPRFCLVAAEFRPRRWLMIFPIERLHIGEDGHQGAHEVGDAPRGVGRAPTLVDRWAPSSELLPLNIFYYFPK